MSLISSNSVYFLTYFIILTLSTKLAIGVTDKDYSYTPKSILQVEDVITATRTDLSNILPGVRNKRHISNQAIKTEVLKQNQWKTRHRIGQNHNVRVEEESRLICRNKYNDVGICMPATECAGMKGIGIGQCILSNDLGLQQASTGTCCLSLSCSSPKVNSNMQNTRRSEKRMVKNINKLLELGLRNTRDVRMLLGPSFKEEIFPILPVTAELEQCGLTGTTGHSIRPKGTLSPENLNDINVRNNPKPKTLLKTVQVVRDPKSKKTANFDTNIPVATPIRSANPRLQGSVHTPGGQPTSNVLMAGFVRNVNIPKTQHNENPINMVRHPFASRTFGPRHHGFGLGHASFHQRWFPQRQIHFADENPFYRIPPNRPIFTTQAFGALRNRRHISEDHNAKSYLESKPNQNIKNVKRKRMINSQMKKSSNIRSKFFRNEPLRESLIFSQEERFVKQIRQSAHNPWMLALWIRTHTGQNVPTCGAALISRQYAITAGHCVNGNHGFKYILRGGSSINILPPPKVTKKRITGEDEILSGVEDDKVGGVRIDIEDILIHPDFNPFTFENDIALIKFKDPIITRRDLFPICLPAPIVDDQITDYSGTIATVAGWGCEQDNCDINSVPTRLQEVKIPIVPNELAMCWFFRDSVKLGREEYIPAQLFIVGGDKSASTATCKGDSGSPVVREKPDNIKNNDIKKSSVKRWEVIGLVSWSKGCGRQFRPSVWTRVENFVGWILTNMDEEDQLQNDI